MPLIAPVAPAILSHVLREKPYESYLSRLKDRLNPSRIIYADTFNLAQMQDEIRLFQSGKVITRGRWIPAGDVVPRTAKRVLPYFLGGENALDFVMGNIPDERPEEGSIKNGIYASGKYASKLRKAESRHGDYWLHIVSPSEFWPTWDEIDILGTRK